MPTLVRGLTSKVSSLLTPLPFPPIVDATQAALSTDISAAVDNAAVIEAAANADIMQQLTNLINGLADNSSSQHNNQSFSIAALELTVASLSQNKADKLDVANQLAANRGKLPNQTEIGSCTAQLQGQLRFNTVSGVVEVCVGVAFKPVVFNPPGELRGRQVVG